jgi:hypothetical protein
MNVLKDCRKAGHLLARKFAREFPAESLLTIIDPSSTEKK